MNLILMFELRHPSEMAYEIYETDLSLLFSTSIFLDFKKGSTRHRM